MNQVLFLCSGNYYRSRMAEEYFNHRASIVGIDWRADSMALRKDLQETGNVGPLSADARHLLESNGIPVMSGSRMPRTVVPERLAAFSAIISMSQKEHAPMIESLWPGVFPTMTYWEVGDIGVDEPSAAFEKVCVGVDELLTQLKRAEFSDSCIDSHRD